MLSAPLLGGLIDAYAKVPGTRFGFIPMFGCAAGMIAVVAAFYGLTAARTTDDDTEHAEDLAAEEFEKLSVSKEKDGEERPAPAYAATSCGSKT